MEGRTTGHRASSAGREASPILRQESILVGGLDSTFLLAGGGEHTSILDVLRSEHRSCQRQAGLDQKVRNSRVFQFASLLLLQ